MLLKEDGLWRNFRSRYRLARILLRIFSNLIPRWLKICRPGYHPDQIKDPQWGLDWAELYRRDPLQASQLDTGRFEEPVPVSS